MTNPLPLPMPRKGMNDKMYNALKLSATLLLPSLQALYFAIAEAWKLPHSNEVVGTLAAVNVFAGVVVKFSQMLYEASGSGYSGTIQLEDNEDGTGMRLTGLDVVALTTKDAVTFRVIQSPPV